jgi:hypothetical protein
MDITKLKSCVHCGTSPDRDNPQLSTPLENSASMNSSKHERKEVLDSFPESPAKRIRLNQSIDNNVGECSSDATAIPAIPDITASSSKRGTKKGTAPVKPEFVLLPTSCYDLYLTWF